jgi:hypothetical protein
MAVLAGLCLAAAILKTACKWAGVTPPDFFPAMGICLLTSLVKAIVAFGVVFAFAGVAGATRMTEAQLRQVSPFMTVALLLVDPLASAGVYQMTILDCSFKRGLLVWLNQILVVVIIIAIIVAAVYGLQTLQKGASR